MILVHCDSDRHTVRVLNTSEIIVKIAQNSGDICVHLLFVLVRINVKFPIFIL
jgi:hypothetical protein